MGTVGPEEMGAVYEVLGPGGPHQSIHDWKTDCVVDLIKRSLTAPVSMCKGPKFEGAKPESNGAIESTNEEPLVTKGGSTAQIATRSGNWVDRHCLDLEGMESTGQG